MTNKLAKMSPIFCRIVGIVTILFNADIATIVEKAGCREMTHSSLNKDMAMQYYAERDQVHSD